MERGPRRGVMEKRPLEPRSSAGRGARGPGEGVLPGASDAELRALGATRVIPPKAAGVEAPPAEDAMPPSANRPAVLGDFRLIKKVGEGAMGAVYKAHQSGFERQVALKVLFKHIAANPKLVERLYREG